MLDPSLKTLVSASGVSLLVLIRLSQPDWAWESASVLEVFCFDTRRLRSYSLSWTWDYHAFLFVGLLLPLILLILGCMHFSGITTYISLVLGQLVSWSYTFGEIKRSTSLPVVLLYFDLV